ncbi:MAG: hypothetical protein AAB426_14575 [Myxococcota bacterium]
MTTDVTEMLDSGFGAPSRRNHRLGCALGKRIGFLVTQPYQGYWELDLAAGPDAAVRSIAPTERPAVCFTITSEFLPTFLSGKFSGQRASEEGKMRIEGCEATFRRFLRVLESPKAASIDAQARMIPSAVESGLAPRGLGPRGASLRNRVRSGRTATNK